MTNMANIIIAFLAISIGGFTQGSVGFGCGLMAVPIMVSADIPLPHAVAIVCTSSIFQCWFGWSQNRHLVRWRETILLFLLRSAALPIGVFLMALLIDFGREQIRQLIGVVMLFALVLQWIRVAPRAHLATRWTVLAGTTSGLLAGLMGVGAAPLVLWTSAHNWSGDRIRTFLWMMFLQTTPLQLLLLYLNFGTPILKVIPIGLALTPACIAGAILGSVFGRRMSSHVLRTLSYGLIMLMAIACFVRIGPH